MPFYEYQCAACGAQVEVLQKISDAPLKKCPECGKSKLAKLVSAPVFRLKGAGWYETDFKTDKDNKRNLVDSDKGESSESKTEAKAESKPEAKGDVKPESKAEARPEAKATGGSVSKAVSGSGSSSGSGGGSRSAVTSARKPAAKSTVRASSRKPSAASRKVKGKR